MGDSRLHRRVPHASSTPPRSRSGPPRMPCCRLKQQAAGLGIGGDGQVPAGFARPRPGTGLGGDDGHGAISLTRAPRRREAGWPRRTTPGVLHAGVAPRVAEGSVSPPTSLEVASQRGRRAAATGPQRRRLDGDPFHPLPPGAPARPGPAAAARPAALAGASADSTCRPRSRSSASMRRGGSRSSTARAARWAHGARAGPAGGAAPGRAPVAAATRSPRRRRPRRQAGQQQAPAAPRPSRRGCTGARGARDGFHRVVTSARSSRTR